MKASDAKKFIGQYVSYLKADWPRPQFAIIKSTVGRNIITDTDALWAPDISDMKLVEEDQPVSSQKNKNNAK